MTSAIPAAAVPSPAPLSEWASLDRRALEGRLSKAMRQGKDAELPMLHLALADRSLVNHEQADAEEFLRKAILGATAADQKTIHARARVTLGDLAHGSGDLTTACEHWQIARGIFLELSRSADQEAVERRMQRNGCPTDWVLTEF